MGLKLETKEQPEDLKVDGPLCLRLGLLLPFPGSCGAPVLGSWGLNI